MRFVKTAGVAAIAVGLMLGGAAAANARPVPHDAWLVTSTSHAYTTYGRWHTCYTVKPDVHASSASCSISQDIGNHVSGTIGVGYGPLSTSVGCDVTGSKAVSASQTFRIPAKAGGLLQWREVFSTKTVHQTKYRYDLMGRRKAIATATAYASRYVSPQMRYAR